jgi:hypothetical protein
MTLIATGIFDRLKCQSNFPLLLNHPLNTIPELPLPIGM